MQMRGLKRVVRPEYGLHKFTSKNAFYHPDLYEIEIYKAQFIAIVFHHLEWGENTGERSAAGVRHLAQK